MENASKALLFAGAMLLAILIIGLTVFIYNQAAHTVNDTGMDQVAVRQFNGQFESYINREISATTAKSLIDTVEQSNRVNDNHIELFEISNRKSIIMGHKYKTEVNYVDGVITGIGIIDVDNETSGSGTENEHNITEPTERYNDRLLRFVGENKTRQDVRDLLEVMNEINDLYGSETVVLLEQKEPPEGYIVDNRIIKVNKTYSDEKIKEMGLEIEYHEDKR